MTVNRQPRGIPTGGQYAANSHDDARPWVASENETQKEIRERLAEVKTLYPNAASVHLTAMTRDPYDPDYDDGVTLVGTPRIDGIYDAKGASIWDSVLSRRDPRLERIEDSFPDALLYSDLPQDSSVGSSRGNLVGIDL